MTPGEITRLAEQHLAIWNEKDETKKNILMQQVYSPGIEMIDVHFTAVGYKPINDFIRQLHDKNPGAVFMHTKTIDAHSNVARLFWQFGTKDNPANTTGMDLFIIENEKISKLYVFPDKKDQ